MGLVCEDMRKYGWRPIWFNAWHHQKEDQLLPALLDALRIKGLPPLHTPAGLLYRLKLLWMRSKKHYLLALLAVSVSAALIGYFISHSGGDEWAALAVFAKSLASGDADWTALLKDWTLPSLLLQLAAAIPVILTVRNALKAFGMDPAVLLTSSMDKTRLKDVSALTGFRTQFAREFDEVTKSLAFPPVIVIDDLDRCQPNTVLDIMEAVNFLTSSGRCFVIFGMARERVQASLALSFKEIARELAEFDLPISSDQPDEKDERDKRQRYAQDYLEKLVNIEVIVPDRKDIPPHRLLEQDRAEDAETLYARAMRWLKPIALVAPLLLVAGLAGIWGNGLSFPDAEKQTPTVTPEAAPAEPPPATLELPKTEAEPPVNKPSGPVIIPGDNQPVSSLWFLLGLAAFVALAAVMIIRRLRMENVVVSDTEDFRNALRIWSPIATYSRNSPRAIKRFGNRIRYLAMLQQGAQLDDKPWLDRAVETSWNWLKARKRGTISREAPIDSTEQKREQALSEHRVVALGALHEYCGEGWKKFASDYWELTHSDDENSIESKIHNATDAYEETTGVAWPPSDEEIEAFERSLRGVRVEGESVPIRERRFRTSASTEESDFSKSEFVEDRTAQDRESFEQPSDKLEKSSEDRRSKEKK